MSSNHNIPTFLGIGAQKAGTTSLYNYLAQHPGIYFSPLKNLKFFCTDWKKQPEQVRRSDYKFADFGRSVRYGGGRQVADWDEYRKFFAAARGQVALGEFTPGYLCLDESPALIARRLPDVKIIAILRDPVDRLISHFNFYREKGMEPIENIIDAIEREDVDARHVFSALYRNDQRPRYYIRNGLYGRAINRYLKYFNPSQLLVCSYDELSSEPQKTCSEIFEFLGVDQHFKIDSSVKHNETSSSLPSIFNNIGKMIPISKRLKHHAKNFLRRSMTKTRQNPVSDSTRQILEGYFIEDLKLLSSMVRSKTLETFRTFQRV